MGLFLCPKTQPKGATAMLNNTNLLANAFWAFLDSTAIIVSAYLGVKRWKSGRVKKITDQDTVIETQKDEIAKHTAEDAVKIQIEALVAKFDVKFDELSIGLAKINYALFNAGKTGLVNKVDSIIENQQDMREDVAVLKARRQPRG